MSKTVITALVLFSCIYLVTHVHADVPRGRALRLHIPFLGIGPICNGCPPRHCDDDMAIILGYCCGCAKLFDRLPVKCSRSVVCPPNTYGVCQAYEYMMHCCCHSPPPV